MTSDEKGEYIEELESEEDLVASTPNVTILALLLLLLTFLSMLGQISPEQFSGPAKTWQARIVSGFEIIVFGYVLYRILLDWIRISELPLREQMRGKKRLALTLWTAMVFVSFILETGATLFQAFSVLLCVLTILFISFGWMFCIRKSIIQSFSRLIVFTQTAVFVMYSSLTLEISGNTVLYLSLVLVSPYEYWFMPLYLIIASVLILLLLTNKGKTWTQKRTGSSVIRSLFIVNIVLSLAIMFSYALTTEDRSLDSFVDFMNLAALIAGLFVIVPLWTFSSIITYDRSIDFDVYREQRGAPEWYYRLTAILEVKWRKILKQLEKEQGRPPQLIQEPKKRARKEKEE